MLGLFIIRIEVFRLPPCLCRFFLAGARRGGMVPSEMVALASRVPALPLVPVPVVPVPSLSPGALLVLLALPGLLLARLPGFSRSVSRYILAGPVLPGLL